VSVKSGEFQNADRLSDDPSVYDKTAIQALKLAQAILRDEFQRRQLPQFQKPSVESRPYG